MSDHDNVVLDILCCVMVADGKASRCEKAHIVELMANYASDTSEEEVIQHIIGFVAKVKSDGFKSVLKRSCTNARSLDNEAVGELVYLCYELADADSEVDDREKKVIEQIRRQIQKIPGVQESIKRARQAESPVAENFKSPESLSQRLMFIAVVLAVPLGIAFYLWETSDFRQIAIGMSVSEVHEIMGPPVRVQGTGTFKSGHQNYVHFRNSIVTSKRIGR
jgi:uncharacterized tellurite resistance protein B-like protein